MTGAVLFEHRSRGDLWRLEVAHYQGRTFLQWRKWWSDDGVWKPSRHGVTMPPGRLAELYAAIAAYLAAKAPTGAQIAA